MRPRVADSHSALKTDMAQGRRADAESAPPHFRILSQKLYLAPQKRTIDLYSQNQNTNFTKQSHAHRSALLRSRWSIAIELAGAWSNGRTADSESAGPGSNPGVPSARAAWRPRSLTTEKQTMPVPHVCPIADWCGHRHRRRGMPRVAGNAVEVHPVGASSVAIPRSFNGRMPGC